MANATRLFRSRSFRSSRDGSIAVEFALIAPVVLVMLLGVIEVSSAISQNLSVQASARAGTDFGLTKPPVQGNVQPIIDAVKAAMPKDWASAASGGDPAITAALVCECEVTGAIACSSECGKGELKQTFLKVDVKKTYAPLVNFRFIKPTFKFSNTSQVRLN